MVQNFKVVDESTEITSNSILGKRLLAQSIRLLEEGNENDDNQEEIQWIGDYSLKFQGCHHVQQWNDDADEDADVRIATKRLVRFRLCPSGSCSANKAAGCNKNYGDYIVDIDTFLATFLEAERELKEYQCEKYLNYKCDCDDDDNKGDDFNPDYCAYDCYAAEGMQSCMDYNPYEEDEDERDEFDVEDYLQCAQFGGNNDRRRLEDGDAEEQDEENEDENDNDEDADEADEEVELFIGPYCAEQGGAVFMGMFTDDSCTEFADDYGGAVYYNTLTGQDLPYGDSSLVSAECVSCLAQDDENNEAGVSEQCSGLYVQAGKCEETLPEETNPDPNNAACNYISGIKIIRKDGIIDSSNRRPNPIMTAVIVIFAMAFCAMGFYVWYLRMRLGKRRKNALL
uniref:Uncharacterized protein n=1 Tax=Grammatophora oceanica TaxID=210454 RepID=A0A7S1Y1F6_9STRA